MKVHHAQLFTHPADDVGLRLEGGGVAVHLNQQHGASVHRQAGVGIVLHSADQGLLLKFHDGGHHTAGHNGRNSLGRVFNLLKRHADSSFGLRQRNKLEGDFGNDAQRALATGKKLGEVVAGHVLNALPAAADDVA